MSQRALKIAAFLLVLISLFGGIFFGYILSEVDKRQELNRLATYLPTTPTKLYDIHGIAFAELFKHRQELLKFRDIPPQVVNAFIAVEDNNFYNHFGIDFFAIGRAALVNLVSLKIKQGGSTITQQLSKAILKNTRRSFTRKFIEALLTLQIEEEYSKEEILEIYFNLVYLGHGATGLSTAASVYFSKDVQELDLPEAALLARLPKAPVDYSPFKNPDAARRAHLVVLKVMSDNGFIPKDQIQKIHTEFWEKYWPIVITKSPSSSQWGVKLDRAPYFTEQVRRQLVKELGEELVYTGGLKVYTTLDIQKQEIADEVMKSSLYEFDKKSFGQGVRFHTAVDGSLFGYYNMLGSIFPISPPEVSRFDDKTNYKIALENELIDGLDVLSLLTPVENPASAISEFRKRTAVYSKNLHVEGAFITIEPSTGYIVTMVGGSKFSPKNQFNRAMQARRQTGSSFKPFVYGAAIEERTLASGTGLMDAPITSLNDDGQGWSPEDATGDFRGMIPAYRALALSLNIASVQIYFKTGPEPIIDFASRATKTNKRRYVYNPALALGVAELTPYELALGYAVIANKGRDVIPFTVRYVQDQSGRILWNKEKLIQEQLAKESADGTIQLISEGAAFIIKKMLMGVADAGTPTGSLRDAKYFGQSGGKTGSTTSFTNVWYAGFDPRFTSVIWMGYDKNSISLGRGIAAATLAVPIWGKIYHNWYPDNVYPEFVKEPPPEEVVMGGTCAKNGLSPKPGVCPVGSSMYLKPIQKNGEWKSAPFLRQCDGDRDHHSSVDFRDFLQKEYEISDEEIGKKDTFRTKTE